MDDFEMNDLEGIELADEEEAQAVE